MEPLLATIEADLAIGPLLRRTIPDYLQVIDNEARLPPLPMYLVNMYLPPVQQSEIALELARHIRQEFASRFRRHDGHEPSQRARRRLDAVPALVR
jgi:hypothetical protein